MSDETVVPLVSVVIPTHNRADLLSRAIRSVLNQTYRNIECIVVDDASADNTQQIVSSWAKDPRLIAIRHEINKRGSAARNTGIARARGEMIAFLDDDDEWLPTKLEKQVRLMSSSSESVGLVYCWMDYYGADGSVIEEHRPVNRGYVFPEILDNNHIGGCPTLLLRRSVIDTVGGFNENLTVEDDYEFVMRVCKVYEVDLVEEVLVKVDYGHGLPQTSQRDFEDPVICRQIIKSNRSKIEIVGADVRKYRKHVSHYLNLIAYAEGCLGDWRSSVGSLGRAFRCNPLCWETPSFLAKLVKRRIRKAIGRNAF